MILNKFHINAIKNNVWKMLTKDVWKKKKHSLCFVGIKLYKPLFSSAGYD